MADTPSVPVIDILRRIRDALPPGSQNPITFLCKDNPLVAEADAAILAIAALMEESENAANGSGGNLYEVDPHTGHTFHEGLCGALFRTGYDPARGAL